MQQESKEVCKKFIMVDDQQSMNITPLQTQYMTPPPNEVDVDNQSLQDPDEEDENCELLIKAFSPQNDQGMDDDIQKVTNNQDVDCNVLEEDEQQVTCEIIHNELSTKFTTTFVYAKLGTDHYPLLMEMNATEWDHIKYFKFLNCWTDQPKFLDIVQKYWDRELEGNMKYYESRVKVAKDLFIQSNTEENRTALHGLNVEYIRGRRRRLFIHRILREAREWVQGDDNIGEAACDHFQQIFTGEENHINEGPLECIPRMLNQEHNTMLTALPTMDEPQINHLSFANDIIIFTSGRKKSLELIMHTLDTYEEIVGQLVPLIYLGYPIYIGRQRILYFFDLINKVVGRITGWKAKILSFGGRATLFKHLL
ncbi:hypothetical protein H5410_003070 [Solanum commersonii]|uniref:Uncharacterized protein n=1 Tax=Solanum commersonii TaxID=4109 RepID=A0A9J6B3S2_SOLCO|nr:hypothetical protein H5410_003070 [Solanum commersonii]